MPLIVPSETRSWNRTPAQYLHTRRYEVLAGPRLDRARAIQRVAFDWALGELEASPHLKVRAKGDSLWRRLTQARAQGAFDATATVNLQRAAAAQAHQAFARREQHAAEQAKRALGEQDEEVTPRTLRRIARAPKAPAEYRRSHPAEYRRSHPAKQGRRQAVAVLEGVWLGDDRCTVRVRGVGTFVLTDEVLWAIRSAQLVEHRGKVWLHAQHGESLPEPKAWDGRAIGLDSGVTRTLTASDGTRWVRPDTGKKEREARSIERHRRRCCTRGSRGWKRHGRRAQKLRRDVANVQRNWERHVAKEVSTTHGVVGMENLELRNMTASGKGTTSLPGTRTKKGLNRGLKGLGKLHEALHRRCVRDGTWAVAVNPRNTSILCPSCGHKDRGSRKGEQFECTRCAHRAHADENAGVNVRERARNVLVGYHRTRGARESCPGGRKAPDRQGRTGSRGEAGASLLRPREGSRVRPSSRTDARSGMVDMASEPVKSST